VEVAGREAGLARGRARLASAALAGALAGGLTLIAAIAVLNLAGPEWAPRLLATLRFGGWIAAASLGAAIGMIASLRGLATRRGRTEAVLGAIALATLAVVVIARVQPPPPRAETGPDSARGKARAFLKWSYRSPAEVARLLPYAADPDPIVREQAVLAMGLNTLVTDAEKSTPMRPPRFRDHPTLDSLRTRLGHAMREDPVAPVRAEAARALWNAPRAFGPQPAAAETLAAFLDRAARSGATDRTAWLALDAAAGAPDPGLKAAAARFASATADSQLARAARQAAR
jgi:hypothetical protein